MIPSSEVPTRSHIWVLMFGVGVPKNALSPGSATGGTVRLFSIIHTTMQWWIQNYQEGFPTIKRGRGGAKILFGQIFLKTARQIKKIGPRIFSM